MSSKTNQPEQKETAQFQASIPARLHRELKCAAAARGLTLRELYIGWATKWLAGVNSTATRQ